MSIKPIKPGEIQDIKNAIIPDIIIDCINELLLKNWNGERATFKQNELLEIILLKDTTLTGQKLMKEHLLDFEDIYRKQGWVVEYDKPGYNEEYEAYFVFKKKGKA